MFHGYTLNASCVVNSSKEVKDLHCPWRKSQMKWSTFDDFSVRFCSLQGNDIGIKLMTSFCWLRVQAPTLLPSVPTLRVPSRISSTFSYIHFIHCRCNHTRTFNTWAKTGPRYIELASQQDYNMSAHRENAIANQHCREFSHVTGYADVGGCGWTICEPHCFNSGCRHQDQ